MIILKINQQKKKYRSFLSKVKNSRKIILLKNYHKELSSTTNKKSNTNNFSKKNKNNRMNKNHKNLNILVRKKSIKKKELFKKKELLLVKISCIKSTL